MKHQVFFLVAAVVAMTTPGFGQRVVSPEVGPDGKVTFRLKAPDASKVEVHCEGVKESAMQKDDQGVWSLTSEALEPDIYSYNFTVDGVRAIDPSNPLIKYNLINISSEAHVRGPKTLAWEMNDVPHGELHRHLYHSEIGGDDRDFIVYTPPGYDSSSHRRYPVLYLLHGFSDNTIAWTATGRAHVILDNLIARKEAKPMIVVMPLGYGKMEVLRNRAAWNDNLTEFRSALLTEVMPRAEKEYRISEKQADHAIAGLSMGGTESLLIGLNETGKFGWVGSFSEGGLGTDFASRFPELDKSGKAPEGLRLLWIGCGEQDGLLKDNQALTGWLEKKEIAHTWVHIPGQHSFRVWRRDLAQFAPLLFQDKK